MTKIAYILPGFGKDASQASFLGVRKSFFDAGYKVIPIRITWKYRTLDNWILEFLDQATKHVPWDEVVVFGFSFWALIAFVSAAHLNPDKLFLASLSPYFAEDLPFLKPWWRRLDGKRRLEVFEKHEFSFYCKEISSECHLFYGTREPSLLIDRVVNAHRLLPESQLYRLEGVRHNISDVRYVVAIQKAVNSFS